MVMKIFRKTLTKTEIRRCLVISRKDSERLKQTNNGGGVVCTIHLFDGQTLSEMKLSFRKSGTSFLWEKYWRPFVAEHRLETGDRIKMASMAVAQLPKLRRTLAESSVVWHITAKRNGLRLKDFKLRFKIKHKNNNKKSTLLKIDEVKDDQDEPSQKSPLNSSHEVKNDEVDGPNQKSTDEDKDDQEDERNNQMSTGEVRDDQDDEHNQMSIDEVKDDQDNEPNQKMSTSDQDDEPTKGDQDEPNQKSIIKTDHEVIDLHD